MICYKDKTFCVSNTCQHRKTCEDHVNQINYQHLALSGLLLSLVEKGDGCWEEEQED